MKFKKKNLTLLFFSALIIGVIGVFAISFISKNGSANEGSVFNSNFKNYNRILKIFDFNDKEIANFKVALADNDEKRQVGLMYLKSLPEDLGMVFTFFPSQEVRMWMKNTFIPLDMIFIDNDNEIAAIAKNTKPHSLDIISSKREVIMVLEINADLSDKLGLKVGQKIMFLNQEK